MFKTICITGANRGIGLQLSKNYLENGHKVIACCRNIKNNKLLEISKNNKNLILQQMDVSSEESIKNISESINYPIDLLICNAGIGSSYEGIASEANTQEKFAEVLSTNVIGVFLTVKYFLEKVKAGQEKKIAIISSLMGSQHHTSSNAYFYRSSKAAVNNVMRTLSNELFQEKISVSSYHPGWVRTDMGGSNADLSTEESAEYLIKRFEEMTINNSGNFINYNGEILKL